MDTAVVWSVALVAVAGGFALLVRVLRAVGRVARTMEDFADDWHGESERPGVARRAGVMERLDGIETRLSGVEERLGGKPSRPSGRPPVRAVP